MLQIVAAFILVCLMPFMFGSFRRSLTKAYVFDNKMPILERNDGFSDRITNTRFVWFEFPEAGGGHLMADISVERYEALEEQLTPATVVVAKMPFCRPKIEYVSWEPGEEAFETADKTPAGIFAMLLYLFAGFGFMIWAKEFDVGIVHQTALYMSATLLALAGFTAAMARASEFTKKDVREAPLLLLGFIPVGKGFWAFLLAAILCLVATIFLFSSLNILTFFLGLNTSMALGCLLYFCWRSV